MVNRPSMLNRWNFTVLGQTVRVWTQIRCCRRSYKSLHCLLLIQQFWTHQQIVNWSCLVSINPSPAEHGYTVMKTRLYNIDPLKPHFYTVKLGFSGVYIIFLISAQNIDCGYSLDSLCQGGSIEYPQSMF